MNKLAPIAMLATAGLLLVAGPSQAAVKWTFQSGYCVGPCGESGRTFETSNETNGDVGNDVAVTGWGATEPGGTNNQLASGRLMQYGGGLGVINADDPFEGDAGVPEHAMDNKDRFDAILYDFGGQQVSLSDISIGYFSGDADISVLAYTGADPFNTSTHLENLIYGDINGNSAETFTGNGWSIIGNYDVNTSEGGGVYSQAIDTSVSSSYWLIGAYNPEFGSCSNAGDTCSLGDADHVKLLSLTASLDSPPPPNSGVPEPSSLLMLAFGIMAPAAVRRRRKPAAA